MFPTSRKACFFMFRTESRLEPGERLIARKRRHPLVLLRAVLLNLGAAAVLVGLANALGIYWFLFFYLIPFSALVWELLSWIRIETVLTDRRVIEESVFPSGGSETPLDSVEGVFLDQSLTGRIFNYGTIRLERNEASELRTLRFIPDPARFYDRVLRQWRERRPAPEDGDSRNGKE